MRIALGVLGAALAAYGGWLLLHTQNTHQVLAVGTWLVAGVLLHDAVLAPVTIALGWAAARRLSPPVAAGAVVLLVVLGSASLVAVPVLVNGAEPQTNPTLLVRDYPLGWLELAAACLALAALVTAAALRSDQARRRNGADPGRR